jgi:2Fe-2S ferredoxin
MAVTCAAPTDKDTVMTVAVENRVDMEAACDGQLSCSTCHVVLDKELYKKLEKSHPPTEEELDMLDTAFGLTPTSRLGCQIPVSVLPDGVTITIPSTR